MTLYCCVMVLNKMTTKSMKLIDYILSSWALHALKSKSNRDLFCLHLTIIIVIIIIHDYVPVSVLF